MTNDFNVNPNNLIKELESINNRLAEIDTEKISLQVRRREIKRSLARVVGMRTLTLKAHDWIKDNYKCVECGSTTQTLTLTRNGPKCKLCINNEKSTDWNVEEPSEHSSDKEINLHDKS
jgi:hypothetical protein